MSLTDRTNESIPLSIDGLTMTVDLDSDSSFDPNVWVDIDFSDPAGKHTIDDESVSLTLEEAGLLHDRLGLILGRSGRITHTEIATERARQIAMGYDAEHDRKHGALHVFRWALIYGLRGEALKSQAMVRAGLDLLEAVGR